MKYKNIKRKQKKEGREYIYELKKKTEQGFKF